MRKVPSISGYDDSENEIVIFVYMTFVVLIIKPLIFAYSQGF